MCTVVVSSPPPLSRSFPFLLFASPVPEVSLGQLLVLKMLNKEKRGEVIYSIAVVVTICRGERLIAFWNTVLEDAFNRASDLTASFKGPLNPRPEKAV